MTTETMSIHKGLSELKIIADRITDKIDSNNFCLANKKSNKKINGVDVQVFKDETADVYKSICDLIKRRDAIKKAITLSNATTHVEIAGTDYTVAEAIAMHTTGLLLPELLLTQLKRQQLKVQGLCNLENEKIEEKIHETIQNTFDGSTGKKIDTSAIESFSSTMRESMTYELVTGINLDAEIKRLETEIDTFKSEVDAALSESNAVNTITIEY